MAGLRTVGVKLAAEVSGYVNNLRTAKSATTDFAGELDKSAKAGKLDAVADSAGKMGLALAGGFGVMVNAAAQFDKQMSAVDAATHASAGEMERLRQAAIQAGADTQFSATQAAKGIEELSKAGISTNDILRGGLNGALSLAAAGEMDVGAAAETAASAMTQFKLSGSAVPHIADLLAAGAGKAQGNVHDMSLALGQSGLVAAQMGMTLDDTVGTLAAFAHAGLLSSDAGTSLKTALLMLTKPTTQAQQVMQDLGISVYDASGKFVGITNFAGQLQTKLGGLTQEQRNSALATIFGSDAIRAASILYQNGAKGIDEWRTAVNDQGYAADTARRKTDNLAGDLERLKGSLETMAIQAGSGANGGLRTLTQAANGLVNQFAAMPPFLSQAITVMAGVTGVALLAGAGWVKMRGAVADTLGELAKAGPVGQRAAAGLETASKWAGRAAIAFAALQVAGIGVNAAFGSDLNPQINALSKSLADFGKSGAKTGEAARLLGGDFQHLAFDLGTLDSGFWTQLGNGIAGVAESLTSTGTVTDETLQHAKERITALDAALAQLVSSGHADDAAAAFERIAAQAAKQHISIDDLKNGLPQYQGAIQTAGDASSTAAGQVGAVGTAAAATAAEVKKLKDAFDQLFGVQMTLDKATIAYQQGIVDLNKELLNGARTLDINTQEGRTNSTAVLAQIQHIQDLRKARIDHGVTLDEANGKYVRDIDGLRASMVQAGFTKGKIEELTGAYRAIPAEVGTTVKADTSPAAAALNGFEHRINTIDGRVITVYSQMTSRGEYIPGQGTQVKNDRGGVYEHAAVGALRDAQIASPMGPARYAWAEPSTGGEAFIPKRGNANRSLNILDRAASWYGATVRPAYSVGAGGGTQVVEHRHVIVLEGSGVLTGLRKEIRIQGGNVQTVLGQR